MRTKTPAAVVAANDQLVAMLRTIGERDASAELDSRSLQLSL